MAPFSDHQTPNYPATLPSQLMMYSGIIEKNKSPCTPDHVHIKAFEHGYTSKHSFNFL